MASSALTRATSRHSAKALAAAGALVFTGCALLAGRSPSSSNLASDACGEHAGRAERLGDGQASPDGGADDDACVQTAEIPTAEPPSSETPPPAGAGAGETGARRDFNLVVLTIDALRIDLGFMGYPRPVSPHLDALAKRSTVFERAYSMSSYTGKSLGPMMIGKFASECWRDGGHFDAYRPENTLLAERLQSAGFRTMGAASHWYFDPKFGLSQGMDTWDLSTVVGGPGGPVYSLVTSAALTDVGIKMLSDPKNVQGRFFLWIHYLDPHQYYIRHPETPDLLPVVNNGDKALYDGEVWYTDHHVGRLLDFIASSPWADRTIIVVTSDHGEAFGEHGVRGHGVDLWESLVRVPLIVYVPGVQPHRVHVKRSLVDLVPTLLDLLGLPQPPAGELSGHTTAPEILSPRDADREERDIYLDMPAGPRVSQHRALIHGATPGLKLMHEGGALYFVFDLSKDPGELQDLAGNRAMFAPLMQAFDDRLANLQPGHVVGPMIGPK